MREIKFNLWDVERKRMFYDVLELKNDSIEKWFSLEKNTSNNVVWLQHTPLKDKNGLSVYDGCILRFPAENQWEEKNYSCFEVFFHDGDANTDYNIGYSMNRMHNHGSVCGGCIPSFKPKTVSKMIIIGNIHSNPELLK